MLRVVLLMSLLLIVVPPLLLAVAVFLAFHGSPAKCGGSREVTASELLAQSYEQRWLAFQQQLTSGRPASITVTDSEATSRTQNFLATSGAPVHGVRLCFVPGGADVNGTLSPPFGPDIAVRLKGSADLNGRH